MATFKPARIAKPPTGQHRIFKKPLTAKEITGPLLDRITAGGTLNADQLAGCVKHAPEKTCQIANAWLTNEQIAWYVKHQPVAILQFGSHRLSPLQLKTCYNSNPRPAIEHTWTQMTPGQQNRAIRSMALTVVAFQGQALTLAQLGKCFLKEPTATIDRCPERLTARQIQQVASQHPNYLQLRLEIDVRPRLLLALQPHFEQLPETVQQAILKAAARRI